MQEEWRSMEERKGQEGEKQARVYINVKKPRSVIGADRYFKIREVLPSEGQF
jgi:hypothetical protein